MFSYRTIAIALIILALSASTLIYAAKRSVPIGAVVAWSGDVFVYHQDENVGVTVSGIEGVFTNDLIVTTVDARAKILLNDDSILSVGEESRLEIKEFSLEEEKRKRFAHLKLLKGKLRALVARRFSGKGSKFQVETRTAFAEVRGSEFIISITGAGTEIVAISGRVYARSASPSVPGEVLLEGGSGTTVRHVWSLEEPVSVLEEQVTQLFEDTTMPVTAMVQLKESGCVGCHLETFLDMNKKEFIHPGAKRDCKKCHIKQVMTGTEKKIPMVSSTTNSLVFLNVNERLTYSVRVRVRDSSGKEAVSSEVRFTPETVSKTMFNDKKAPVISDFRVEELRKGIFYSASLAWDTNEHSTSTLEYGFPGAASIQISNENQYVTDHRITAGGLLPGRNYIFRAISKDPFGNTSRSEGLTVEVKVPFSSKIVESDAWPSVRGVRVLKIGQETALTWQSNKKTTAVLDIGQVMEGDERSRSGPHWPGFAEFQFRGIYACLSDGCHKGKVHKKTSHPTGRLTWKKAKKPVDLPIYEGDLMLCVTCHTPHSGDHEFRLRKTELDLCTECHISLME
jgi:predicted CXXCH cytochrome family protein